VLSQVPKSELFDVFGAELFIALSVAQPALLKIED